MQIQLLWRPTLLSIEIKDNFLLSIEKLLFLQIYLKTVFFLRTFASINVLFYQDDE